MSRIDAGEQIVQLRRRVDRLRADKARTEGALQSLLERIKTDLGYSSPEEMRREQRKLSREIDDLTMELEEALAEFKKQWDKKLED